MFRILILDEEEEFHMELRRLVAKMNSESILLEEAFCCEEAAGRIMRSAPHLIVMDIQQPGVRELIGNIRASQGKQPEIVIVSSSCDVSSMRQALQWHVLDYLSKPNFQNDLTPILSGLLERYQRERAQKDLPTGNCPPVIQSICQLMEETKEGMFSIYKLAAQFSITPNYLSCLFKKYVGKTFSAFQCEIKMKQAGEMLSSHPFMKVYEVASALGYTDEKYFSRVFGKYYHLSPSQYREKNRFPLENDEGNASS